MDTRIRSIDIHVHHGYIWFVGPRKLVQTLCSQKLHDTIHFLVHCPCVCVCVCVCVCTCTCRHAHYCYVMLNITTNVVCWCTWWFTVCVCVYLFVYLWIAQLNWTTHTPILTYKHILTLKFSTLHNVFNFAESATDLLVDWHTLAHQPSRGK